MVILKSAREIELMRKAGAVAAAALELAGGMVAPGVTTQSIDTAVRKFITGRGAVPSFLHYNGYPASCCISVGSQVIHGIPSAHTVMKDGDIIEQGTHEQLLAQKGFYADLYNSQFEENA